MPPRPGVRPGVKPGAKPSSNPTRRLTPRVSPRPSSTKGQTPSLGANCWVQKLRLRPKFNPRTRFTAQCDSYHVLSFQCQKAYQDLCRAYRQDVEDSDKCLSVLYLKSSDWSQLLELNAPGRPDSDKVQLSDQRLETSSSFSIPVLLLIFLIIGVSSKILYSKVYTKTKTKTKAYLFPKDNQVWSKFQSKIDT